MKTLINVLHIVYINGIHYILLIHLSSISNPILFQGKNNSHSLLFQLSLTLIENKKLNFICTKPQEKIVTNIISVVQGIRVFLF